MNRVRRAENSILCENSVARPPKEGFRSFCDSKIEMKSQRATVNAAERKRGRSEADTGPSLGLSFCGSLSRAVRRHPTRRTALTKRARGRTRQADVELLLGGAVAGRSLRVHSTSMVSCGPPAGGGYRPARFCEPQGCTQNAIRVAPASKRRCASVYSERQRNRRPNARLFPPSGLSHVTLNPTYMPLAPLPPDAQQYPSLATPYIAPVSR